MVQKGNAKVLSGLPHAQGKSFQNLDDYLAHLKTMGAQDRPYYEKIDEDHYRLMTGRGSNLSPPQVFTRQQLQEKYGFTQ